MLIDWFTVGAQVLNFIVLVWLMKRFLYRPVLDAIDAREKLVAGELADAGQRQSEARSERDEFEQKNRAFDTERAALLSTAAAEANTERARLLDAARLSADDLTIRRQEAMQSDAHELSRSIAQRAQQEVFAIARKALSDLAGASLEERVTEVFVNRLRALDAPVKAGLASAIRTAGQAALLRSAFDLPAPQREALQQALDESFSMALELRFETAPALVGGIEFSAGGQKLAWSIADYLASLERSVGELLKPTAKSEAATS